MTQAGDINQDGQLDARDLALLKSLIKGDARLCQHFSTEEMALLDINQDGQVDKDDLTALYGKLFAASINCSPETIDKLALLRNKLKA